MTDNLPNAAFLAAARQWCSSAGVFSRMGSHIQFFTQPTCAIAGTGRAAAVEPLPSAPAVPCAAVAAGPGGGRGQDCRAACCDHGGREGSADYRCAPASRAAGAICALALGCVLDARFCVVTVGGVSPRQTSSSPPTATAQRRCSWRSTGGCLTSHTM